MLKRTKRSGGRRLTEAYMALAKTATSARRRMGSSVAAAWSSSVAYSRSSTSRCVKEVGSLKCTGSEMRVRSFRKGRR